MNQSIKTNQIKLMANDEHLLKESIFHIGRVTSIEGRSIKVTVNKSKNTSHLLYKGRLLRNVSVGSYIKILKGFTKLIGKIEGEYINEDNPSFIKNDKLQVKKYRNEKEKINRILNIKLLGFFDEKGFERGIKELPLIDNECFLLEEKEFNEIHHFIRDGDESITIGSLSLEKGLPIQIGVNSLFASHIGIFGNTGSGKSYTLAKIYKELFEKYKDNQKFKENAQFLLIDFNGEYTIDKCITEKKKVYNLTTKKESKEYSQNKIPVSEDDLIDIELISILANATEKTQKPFISRSLNFYKKVHSSNSSLDYFTNCLQNRIVDVLSMANKDKSHTLIDYLINILSKSDDDLREKLFKHIDWNNKNHHFMMREEKSKQITDDEIKETPLYKSVKGYQFPSNILSKIIHFLYLQLVYDIYIDKAQNEHISPAINKLKSKKDDIEKVLNTESSSTNFFNTEDNMIVINLKDVNLEMKKTLPLLLAKKVYMEQKSKYKKDEKKFLNIIVDEAHNILSEESFREAESWKDYRLETFEEVIKEGRKFGVFLTIASQRPADISATIISQLHNYFLHRLINNKDIQAVEKTISYLDKVSFDYLPIMPTGTCILAGLSAQMPVVIDIEEIPEGCTPNNETINLVENWTE